MRKREQHNVNEEFAIIERVFIDRMFNLCLAKALLATDFRHDNQPQHRALAQLGGKLEPDSGSALAGRGASSRLCLLKAWSFKCYITYLGFSDRLLLDQKCIGIIRYVCLSMI